MAVVVRLIGYLITILFFGYSFLRYRHLWKRGRVPVWIYYGLQIIFCGMLVVCQWWGRIFPDETLRTVLSLVSVFYYCAMFYMPVLCFFRGMIREAGRRRKNPGRVYRFFNHPAKSIYVFLVITLLVGAFSVFRAYHIVETDYSVQVSGGTEENSLTIVLVSDLHLGSAVGRSGVDRLVERVNAMRPDLIVLCGGLFDENTTAEMKDYAGEKMSQFRAGYGVFYVEGKQEVSEQEKWNPWFKETGITPLRDQMSALNSGLQILGLRDPADEKKIAVGSLLPYTDSEQPVIVLSARPRKLEEMAGLGADLVLCGHTLGGRDPLGTLYMMAKDDMVYGEKKTGAMTAITTSGVGCGGIPYKVMAPSEIVKIEVAVKKSSS